MLSILIRALNNPKIFEYLVKILRSQPLAFPPYPPLNYLHQQNVTQGVNSLLSSLFLLQNVFPINSKELNKLMLIKFSQEWFKIKF